MFAAAFCAIITASACGWLLLTPSSDPGNPSHRPLHEWQSAESRLERSRKLIADCQQSGTFDPDTAGILQRGLEKEEANVAGCEKTLVENYSHRWLPLWGKDKALLAQWKSDLAAYDHAHSAQDSASGHLQ